MTPTDLLGVLGTIGVGKLEVPLAPVVGGATLVALLCICVLVYCCFCRSPAPERTASLSRRGSSYSGLEKDEDERRKRGVKRFSTVELSVATTGSKATAGSTATAVPPHASHASQVTLQVPPPPPTSGTDSALPPGWASHITDAGEIFFYNEATNETTWEMPTKSSHAPQRSMACSLAETAENIALAGDVNDVTTGSSYLMHMREHARGQLIASRPAALQFDPCA